MKSSSILFILLIGLLAGNICLSQTLVRVDIDLTKPTRPVSPFIYGKNNVIERDLSNPVAMKEILLAKEAGVRFVRQGGGNNSTKYNWRLKLSSHPDWYNNVYINDWDAVARNMFDKMPGVEGMWSFQLLGKAASNTTNNFNDWSYNQSQRWSGVTQNLAGGGQPNKAGGFKASVEGNPNLYLMPWTADSTVGILDKWFGAKGLGFDKNRIRYWSMDNEPEIWSGTHDDVMKTQCSAEEFMQLYFKVAKAARAKYPGIKLVGPVPANEWQWYNWSGGSKINGQSYCWLEFFIKRIAEEEKASGIRLLDVLDIHYYPESTDAAKCVQFHRVFFDRDYVYPEANGVHTVNGGWDTGITKEYVLGRCSDWLTQYLGANHGIGLAVTETGLSSTDTNVQSVWYASTMGEFMKNGVEIFTPWSWDIGMWETLHLYSRYNKSNYVQSTSQNETLVSAYATINNNQDSMSVILVNRSLTEKQTVNLNLAGYNINPGACTMYSISDLGSAETFVSHTNNALKKTQIQASRAQVSIELAPLSVNTIILKSLITASTPILQQNYFKATASPNPASDRTTLNFSLPEKSRMSIEIFNVSGQLMKTITNSVFESGNHQLNLETDFISGGVYWVKFSSENNFQTIKLIKTKNH